MKRKRRGYLTKTVAFMLIFLLSTGAVRGASIEWDGYQAEEGSEVAVVDFDNPAELQTTTTGCTITTINTRDHQCSAYWTHQAALSVEFKKVLRDWSPYDVFEMWFYAENAQDTQFYLQVVCDQKDSSGASYLGYTVTVQDGWNMVKNEEGRYWIASMALKSASVKNGSLEAIYEYADIEKVGEVMQNAVSVYPGSPNVVSGGKAQPMGEGLAALNVDGVAWVPTEFFSTYLDAKVDQETITLGEKTLELSQLEQKQQDEKVYLNAAQTAQQLGKHVVENKGLVVIGDDESIDLFLDNNSVNVYAEILGYMTAYVDIKSEDLTEEDFKLIKDKWRYELVGDETNALEESYVQAKLQAVESNGRSAWERLDKDGEVLGLFGGPAPDATEDMTAEYNLIRNMALAWGTYGCGLYHNEDLQKDIQYALDFMRDNRYGEAEVNGTGWMSTSAYNWYDWKIGSPSKLVDILMIMEETLDIDTIASYMYCYDNIAHSPAEHGKGSNQFEMAKEMFGSAILQLNAEKAIEARNALDDLYLYSDNGRADGMNFFTDGSYIYHWRHMMNGIYGMSHMELSVSFASMLSGTKLEFTNPQVKNTIEWIDNGYIPLSYDGSVMRMVNGRHPESDTSVSLMKALIHASEIADESDAKRMKAYIKQQMEVDQSIDYYTSLSLADSLRLKEIMEDESIAPSGQYVGNHVYSSGDRVTHQREDFGLGIAMSSSRIYNYEAFQESNLTGWYQGDGMTLIYNKDNQKPYDSTYWRNVDPYKIPGTTVDTQERQALNIATQNEYLSSQDFVGGVGDGEFGAAAMALESYHADEPIGKDNGGYGTTNPVHDCSLTAQKAWFMFDDEVVALGSNINAHDGVPVYTIVDNRKSGETISILPEDQVNKAYPIVSAVASHTPEAQNVAEHTLDDDLSTRWAAEGEASITWELEESQVMGFVGLAFMNGSTRKQIFDLSVSEDGTTWEKVFSGESSGTSEQIELFDLKNTQGKYLKLDSHGTNTASQWISLSTVAIYPPNADGSMEIPEPKYLGTEKISASQPLDVGNEETDISGTTWLHIENGCGYYFPSGGKLMANRTTKATSFFELWFDHGVSPENATYEYVLLPGMDAAETQSYASSPDIEILSNTPEVQAVREKNTGVSAYVFWQAGSFDGITVTQPMMVMTRETDAGLELSVSDPTHKLQSASITLEGSYSLQEVDRRITAADQADVFTLNIDFQDSLGKTLGAVLD